MYKFSFINKNIYFRYCLLLLVVFSCKKKEDKIIINTNEFAVTFNVDNTIPNDLVIHYPTIRKKIKISKILLPITSCFVINTPTIGYLNELDLLDVIDGVCSPNYIYNDTINKKITQYTIMDIGNDQGWNIEKILSSPIQFIFTSYNPNLENIYVLLEKAGKIIIFIEEYKEKHPIGKTEYLKLFGLLFNKKQQSDSIYKHIKNNYFELVNLAKTEIKTKTVFSKIMYGDIWYMPQGESFMAQLYKDANAQYLWKDTKGNSSTSLSFEQVYGKAKEADCWLDVSDILYKEHLLEQNSFYKNFRAFKTGEMYALNGKKNVKNANDFYESGVVRADWVLRDIIYILYPHLLPKHQLKYYKKIQ